MKKTKTKRDWAERVQRALEAGLDPLLDEHETAEALGGIAVATLRRVRWDGSWALPFVKLGNGGVRYRWSAIQAFIASGERTSTSGGSRRPER